MRSADQSARSAEKFFRLHFSVIRMGSRGTFVPCTARSRCMRIDAAERRSGEGPSIDRMQSVPSAVRQASPSLSSLSVCARGESIRAGENTRG